MELRREGPRGGQVVSERLLDDDPGVGGHPARRQAADDGREQPGRDLEVVHGIHGAAHRGPDPLVGRRLVEVAAHVREARGQAGEDGLVQGFAGGDDRLPGACDELLDRPWAAGHADDRAVQQAAPLEPVERVEGHHAREVTRDAEDHERVRRPGGADGVDRGHDGGLRAAWVALDVTRDSATRPPYAG